MPQCYDSLLPSGHGRVARAFKSKLGMPHACRLTLATGWARDGDPGHSVLRSVPRGLKRYQAGAVCAHPLARADPLDLERWAWPPGHTSHGRSAPDACEVGYTWLTRSAIRIAANTEAKLLILTHAFENWHVLRVCFHTDARNQQSRAALERIGGKFEGILRRIAWPPTTSLASGALFDHRGGVDRGEAAADSACKDVIGF
jgi:GNAT acetyltransferase-like protein